MSCINSVEEIFNEKTLDHQQLFHVRESVQVIQSMKKLVEQMVMNQEADIKKMIAQQNQLKDMLQKVENELMAYLGGFEVISKKNYSEIKEIDQIFRQLENKGPPDKDYILKKSSGDQLNVFQEDAARNQEQMQQEIVDADELGDASDEVYIEGKKRMKEKESIGRDEEKWREILNELKMADHREAKNKDHPAYEKQLEILAKIIGESHDERNFYSDDSSDDDECSFYVVDEEKESKKANSIVDETPDVEMSNASNWSVVQSSLGTDWKTVKMVSNAESVSSSFQCSNSSVLVSQNELQHSISTSNENPMSEGGDAVNSCNCNVGICASIGDSLQNYASQEYSVTSANFGDHFAFNVQEFDSLKLQTTSVESSLKEIGPFSSTACCDKPDAAILDEISKTCTTIESWRRESITPSTMSAKTFQSTSASEFSCGCILK